MNREEEAVIIKRVLSGDTDAFEALVLENQTNVYNLALKMTRNENDALDISQEAFLKAYTALGSFRGDSRFSVWIYRLTYNLCIDLARRRRRIPIISLTVEGADGDAGELDLPSDAPTPEQILEQRELETAMADAIARLSEEHRTILLMREVSCMSYDEISDCLGLSLGTVKSRISRARRQTAKFLQKSGTFPLVIRQAGRKEGD